MIFLHATVCFETCCAGRAAVTCNYNMSSATPEGTGSAMTDAVEGKSVHVSCDYGSCFSHITDQDSILCYEALNKW